MAYTPQLPVEVVLHITSFLDVLALRQLCYSTKWFRTIVGPLIYRSQNASKIEHLLRLKTLADQQDVATMIRFLDMDTSGMNHWWPSICESSGAILRSFTSLIELNLRVSRSPRAGLWSAIVQLPTLQTLRIHISGGALPTAYVPILEGLKRLELHFEHIVYPEPRTHCPEILSLIRGSASTLEHIVLDLASPTYTAGFVRLMKQDFENELPSLIYSLPKLKTNTVKLAVMPDSTEIVDTINTISALPITSLHLKCRPVMHSAVSPEDGYGMGLPVLQAISNKLPTLTNLTLEDSEIGRAHLQRFANASIVANHMDLLFGLKQLERVEFPLLLDDLFEWSRANEPSAANAIADAFVQGELSRSRLEQLVDDIITSTVSSHLNLPSTLTSIKINAAPSLKFRRDLSALSVQQPKLACSKRIRRDDDLVVVV